MRIAVSGAHASGKSTLIQDFLARHRDYIHEPEPYEWLVELYGEELAEEPTADDFCRQLEISVERLSAHGRDAHVIAERCPIDFLAYVLALGDLRREPRCHPEQREGSRRVSGAARRDPSQARDDTGRAAELVASMLDRAAAAMRHVDVLAVLPLDESEPIEVADDEDPELRGAMNERLLELVSTDPYELLANTQVIELHGSPQQRLAALEHRIPGTASAFRPPWRSSR